MYNEINRDVNIGKHPLDAILSVVPDTTYRDLLGTDVFVRGESEYFVVRILFATEDGEFVKIRRHTTGIEEWWRTAPTGLYVDFFTPDTNYYIQAKLGTIVTGDQKTEDTEWDGSINDARRAFPSTTPVDTWQRRHGESLCDCCDHNTDDILYCIIVGSEVIWTCDRCGSTLVWLLDKLRVSFKYFVLN